ncbi:unnamed protein product [Allacma fusca]|uniref:Ion transport domain-containing protein n=1 Tax=Allacma fusca TaxID=39272 RepID=A0A8J2P253_9HEXA|nr:unnamed protein product [Allacma fusca]
MNFFGFIFKTTKNVKLFKEQLETKSKGGSSRDLIADAGVCLRSESPLLVLRVAENGSVKEFKRIISGDVTRLNVADSRGRKAVHHASLKNQVGILKIIALYKGNLSSEDLDGNTPLHLAVKVEATDAIDFLLAHGADGTILNKKQQSVLHLAAELNKTLAFPVLAKHSHLLDAGQSGEHGRTPLHLACIHNSHECVRILLEDFKASPHRTCSYSFLPVHEAAKHASFKAFLHLLAIGEKCGYPMREMVNLPDAEGNLALHSAIHGGDSRIVRLCIESGAKISTPQKQLSTPVHLACAQGSLDIVMLMLEIQPEEKDRSLSSCDMEHMTPLHYAAMFDNKDLVEYLESQGAYLNVVDKKKCTPLHLAASNCAWETVRLLIQLDTDVKLQDIDGRTVLHEIVKHHDNLKTILDQDIVVFVTPILELQDTRGNTALHIAAKNGQSKTVAYLLSLGSSITGKNFEGENVFHIACRYGHTKIIEQIIHHKKFSCVLNDGNGSGSTPFHIAASEGHHGVLEVLMKKGAILHRDHEGRTPLHSAAENGKKDVLNLILNTHSHLINLTDNYGNTPLHSAASKNQGKIADLLLRLNCRLSYNEGGYSAVDLALLNNFVEVTYVMVMHKTRGDEVLGLCAGKYPCVMSALVAKMPAVAKAVLDKSVRKSLNEKPDSTDFRVDYDFKWLKRPAGCDDNKYRNQKFLPILNEMVTYSRVGLLSHDLSIKYLEMKWNAYGKYFQYLILILYLIYLSLLTIVATSFFTKDDDFFVRWRWLNSPITKTSQGNDSCGESVSEPFNTALLTNEDYEDDALEKYVNENMYSKGTLQMMENFIAVISVVNICIEMTSIYRHGVKYCLNVDTWVFLGLNFACVVARWDIMLSHPSLAIAAFLGWFYLLLIMQRFDSVGLYVSMFLEILKTLLRVLIIFSILIVAFAMAFYVLLSNGNHIGFADLSISIMRTFSMMLGDLDFMNTFLFPYHCESLEQQNKTNLKMYATIPECKYLRRIPYPMATFTTVCVYMVFMPIVMINLLIGLAVGDIESVRKNAQFKRLAMQVQSHTHLEKVLPKCFLDKVDQDMIVEYPNASKTRMTLMDYVVRIFKQTSPGHEDSDKVNIESDNVVECLGKLSSDVESITSVVHSNQMLMQLICQKLNINTDSTPSSTRTGISSKFKFQAAVDQCLQQSSLDISET